MKALLQKIKQLLKDKRFRKIWYRGVSTIAAIVVFITTYALVLPAITMESEASCGIPAHQHSSECYEERLICGKEESDGHHHTDDCYTTTKELTCELPEHKHGESCYDEEGNLTCKLSEHTHEDGCYEEHKELTCTLQESDGHHHDSSCYEQVLTCGLEAHIHSTECYKEESLAVAASTSATATTAATAVTGSAGGEATHDSPDAVNAASASDSDETAFENTELSGTASNQDAEPEKSLDTSDSAGTDMTNGSDHNTETNNSEDTDTENGEKAEPADNAEITDAATAATTGVLPEPVEQEELSDGYVPTLDPINMEQVLDRHTGFYYYHADETTDTIDGKAPETLESSADITAWEKVNDDTKLAPTDLIKAYFAYTIPAGRLNETNQVARYRLPSNIHLTDDQIIAIDQTVNGVAAAYVDQDTLQVTDADNYNKYLGAEAVEGSRTPDETLVEGTQEYISAVVKAENVFENTLDKDGNYIDANGNITDGPGEYLGQDLIFVFTPYSIEKNQITYDKDGNPTAAGEKIAGWFACDFNTDQIDWVEEETDADLDNTTAEKTADIYFTARDDSLDIEEITQTLKMTELLAAPEEAAGEEANAARESSDAETAASETTAEKAETSSTKAPAETSEEPGAETAETADSASTSEAETQEPQYRDGTLTASGDDYTITLDYTADACIPENAELQVREITAGTDPEAYEACLEQAKAQVVDPGADGHTDVDQEATRFFDIEIIQKVTEKLEEEEDAEELVADNSAIENAGSNHTEDAGNAAEADNDTVTDAETENAEVAETGTENTGDSIRKIEPKAPVTVNIQLSNKADSQTETVNADKSTATADPETAFEPSDPTILHFASEGTEQIESTVGNAEKSEAEDKTVDIQFEAESFSIYGVVYTVDFHWEINGKTYEFSLPGGGYVSLEKLLEVLGVANRNDEQKDDTEGKEDNNDEAHNSASLKLEDVQISEETQKLFNDIEKIEFSNPDLVWVGKVEEESTVGEIKEKNGLEVEYSEELSEEKITEINAQTVKAGDWALIGMRPFLTEEVLTIALETDEVFTIKVTDAQITRDFLSASGKTYTITVIYSENAEIPEGADLRIREILSGSVEEAQYITASAFELGVDNKDINDARFFDIEIIDAEGQKIEPKTPVDVKIEYKDPVEITGDNTLSVLHFADDGTEIIREVSVSDEGQTIEYEQDSFSITGTIVSPEPQNGSADNPRRYMLLVQHEGKYYIVNNDASLTEVSLNPDGTVNIEDPMMWSYEDNHIYYQAEAVDFTSQDVASDYLYRYLNASAPEDDNAYRQEEKNSSDITTWNKFNMFNIWFDTDGDRIDQRDVSLGAMGFEYGNIKSRANRHLWNDMSISYTNNHLYHNNNYLGIEFDEDGVPVRLIGSQSQENAANIVFASANSVPGVDHNNHTVNHIDISITGKSQISVPLAYGTYYYKDENDDFQEYVVNKDIDLTLTKEKIDIEPEDMKGATIKAFDKNGDELHNAFVITGYSSNSKTDYSTPQVRIEGQFKVANLPWMNVDEYNANDNAMSQRLQNIITYTVSATKPITFPLIETDNGYGQLYEKQKDGTYKEISITVDIGMSASFNYWGEDNECPPLQPEYGYTDNWKKGGIHPFNISGMDFKLGGDADNASNHMAALEITKMVLDENHHMIKLDKPYEQSFKVYGSSTNKHGDGGVDDYRNVVGKNLKTHTEDYEYGNKYKELHSKDVTVGSSGMGLVFDYDIEPGGMYYIEEDTSDVPKTIKDEDNNEWTYAYTYIETEYVWRNDGYSGRHESGKYTGLTDGTYISMPEVTGSYTGSRETPPNGTYVAGSDQNSSNWRWFNEKTGLWEEGVYWNGFLEYYVYNVYTQGTKLDVEKEWKTPDIPDNAEVTVELYYATKMVEDKNGTPVTTQSFPESYEAYQPAKNAKIGNKSIFDGVTTEITLKADDKWKNTFENLPITVKDEEGNIYEVDYYAKEKSVKIPGEGGQTIDEHAQDITGRFAVSVVKEDPANASEISDGKVTISNDKKTVQVTVNKVWEPAPDGGSITVELHRYAVKSDGTYSLFVKDQYGTGVPGATVDLYKGEEKIGTYTTDENGNLSVSGLKPGTYKYVQTAAPTGYEMRSGSSQVDSLEAEAFTVDDDKTQEQSKRVELVNQVLKTTGTVTLTVVDNHGQPVRGGAQFDLYKGNEIVEGKSGLVTGNDGKIIVKGLEAGTYKFVQTGTPSDYKMPSNTETDGFTVADNPGVEQSFTQTMTNTLRGKGSVTVTLKDNAENPIGGVKFSLLKDDAEVDSGYTDENGSLVFGNPEMLDEGVYVIHQATAKDGFDLAANQSFEVVEGNAGQTFEKNFINQLATGNVNLVLMRKFGTGDGNQWSKIGNTITGLKAGTTYTIRATTNNKDMIPSHLWYFEAEGTYTNGTVPNQANMTQNWSAADWTIDGNTATKTFTFTPTTQNTTYTIALITDWSVNDLSLEVVRDRSGNVSGLHSSAKAAKKMRLTSKSMRAAKGVSNAPSNPSFTDAEPAEAPEGYANDGLFSIPATITGPNWTYTFAPQDKYDASGNEYKYYVVETGNTLSNYYIKSYSGDPLSENGTITITNAIKPGALTITKEVKVNGNNVPDLYKTIADGTYTFSITGPDGYSEKRSITVTDGVAEATIVLTGLRGGNYTITETGSTNNNGISLDGPKTINVVPGTEASANVAAFVNNLMTTNLVLEKVSIEDLGNPNAATLKGAAFRLEKYTDKSYRQKDTSWAEQTREDTDSTGIFTFGNLIKGYYKIVETKWPDGYIKVENDPRFQVERNDGVYSIKLLDENGSVLQEEDETVIKIKPSAADPTVQFGNEPGAELPAAGGPGTRMFYLLGSILILGAGVLLWRGRRLI